MKKTTSFIQKVLEKLFNEWMNIKTYLSVCFIRKHKVYLFGCPIHPNIGDQAQLYCISNMLSEKFPGHELVMLNWRCSGARMLGLIQRRITKEDRIFCHSGYFMVEHHQELPVYRSVVNSFPDHPIVIFPQTINFSDKDEECKTAVCFNAHANLTLMCRDEISYSTAQNIFNKCKLLLFPDVVTSLIGCRTYNHERDGILFCMRNDSEAFYKPEQIKEVMNRLGETHRVYIEDTSIVVSRRKLERERKQIVEDMIKSFSKYEMVITDRYHGTIFSLIANTPVRVLSSADHKLSSGVKWFSEPIGNKISYVNDLDSISFQSETVHSDADVVIPYYKQHFYDHIWDSI